MAEAREAFLLNARESEREIRDGRETRDNGIEQEREGRETERENHREW